LQPDAFPSGGLRADAAGRDAGGPRVAIQAPSSDPAL